jgi:LPXTG-motif cell wall-anchored protein
MRLARALISAAVVAALLLPAPALAAGGSVSKLTQQVPAFAAPATTTTTSHAPQPTLPKTGDDLILQLIAAVGLLGAGLALRVRLG